LQAGLLGARLGIKGEIAKPLAGKGWDWGWI
jgi:hypothetical protein